MAEKKQAPRWYGLDNAGVLYAALQREEYSAIYRFSAVMTEAVKPEYLQRAIERVAARFPAFFCRIKKGTFWYYLEPNDAPGPFVREDVADPCQPIRFDEDDGWLVRFYYYKKRISFEAFHALSDGAGAMTFFKTLLAAYLEESGYPIEADETLLQPGDSPHQEELEDAYARYAGAKAQKLAMLPKAYPNSGTAEPFYTFHVTMGFVPVDQLREKAKTYGASITEYLAAVLIWVLLQKQERESPSRKRPVALAIPINLRSYFPSKTLRNFIGTVRPYVDPAMGEYTFSEVVDQVRHYMKLNINRQQLRADMTGNVRFQQNWFMKMVPLVLKNPGMIFSYWLFGTRPYSATYTNPGSFRVPESMRQHIRHMEVILGQSTQPRVNCATISYENIMEITFAGTQKETETEREFFRFLVREGLPIKIESNRR